jgi:uncharacterized membrane protein
MSATQTQADGQAPDEGLRLIVPGRSMPAGAGWDWIALGWKAFTAAPMMWILSVVALFVVAIVTALLPIVGSILFQLLQAVIAGGYMAACRSLERGGEFEIEHLLSGFSKRFASLLIVGLIFLVGWLVLVLIMFAFVGMALLGAFMSGDPSVVTTALMGSAISVMLGSLVVLALMVPLVMAYWFAPALVMIHDMPPIDAMKASFFGCLRNIVPFLVYGLVMLVAAVIAAIPLGLGFLVWVPLAIASTYVAYRQIFTEDVSGEAPRPMIA